MKIKFWGARGSIPAPLDSEEVRGKIRAALEALGGRVLPDAAAIDDFIAGLPLQVQGTVGGNTPCVEILAGEHHIILDAGSGIRSLGRELVKGACGQGKGILHLFLSHLHWDHIQGFPFFTPAFIPGNRIFIYSPHKNAPRYFAEQQSPAHFPLSLKKMRSAIKFVKLEERTPVDLGGVTIHNIPFAHPGVSYGYRVDDGKSSMVYATDSEYPCLEEEYLKEYLDFFRGAEVLIFDAQYTLEDTLIHKATWGHSSSFIGLDMAIRSGVKKLVLFHHEPVYDDEEIIGILDSTRKYKEHNYPDHDCEIVSAYEGLTLEV